jgi:WD40 repeat protein
VFSRIGDLILSGSRDNTVRLWDANSGQALQTLRHDEGRILSWSEDDTARVWNANTGEGLRTLRHEGVVRGAVFSDDERRILSWSEDDTARVWHADTGDVLLTLRHDGPVWGAGFSVDGRILSWSEDGTARLWDITDLPEEQLIDKACKELDGDHDTSGLKDRYGIAITTPICTSDAPPVDAEPQD